MFDFVGIIKRLLPWRVRYFLHLEAAKRNIKFPEIFKLHYSHEYYSSAFFTMMDECNIQDFSNQCVCELGPGGSLDSALIAYQLGAQKTILLDIDDLACSDSIFLKGEHCDLLGDRHSLHELPEVTSAETWHAYLTKINAVYLTNGIAGYYTVPSDSVDHVFSIAVLEHVRRNIFEETVREIYRFTKPGGTAFHVVDFRDHLGGKKNHLRFPFSVWEDADHYKMEMYTNRIQCSEICKIFEQVGFYIVRLEKKYFDTMPIARSELADALTDISEDDLMCSVARLMVRKPM